MSMIRGELLRILGQSIACSLSAKGLSCRNARNSSANVLVVALTVSPLFNGIDCNSSTCSGLMVRMMSAQYLAVTCAPL